MLKCETCGTVIESKKTFCPNCGQGLDFDKDSVSVAVDVEKTSESKDVNEPPTNWAANLSMVIAIGSAFSWDVLFWLPLIGIGVSIAGIRKASYLEQNWQKARGRALSWISLVLNGAYAILGFQYQLNGAIGF